MGSNLGRESSVVSLSDITEVNVSQFTNIIERIADMRAENGAEQNRVLNTIDLLQTQSD